MSGEVAVGGIESADERGVIGRQPVVDFSHLRTPAELETVRRIERAAVVVVPEALAGAYAAIHLVRVGATVYVPAGAKVRVHTGPLIVGGDGLGGTDDVLIVIGLLMITSPVTGPVPQRISVVGAVLAPRGSEGALGPALSGGVGTVTYYRYVEGHEVTVLTGQVRLSGASLANPAGRPDDMLIVAGQVLITGPIPTVGYAQVVVAGQVCAPASSRTVLEPRLQVQGQMLWSRSDEPRVVFDDTEVGTDFFRLLEPPVSLVLFGDLTISAGVTEDMVRAKVTDIGLAGDLTAPADLVPLLQVLATDAYGSIRAGDGPGR
ncbi:MAG: hypothetical protein V7637_1274 [Mycobacteriales bacterium]